MSFGRHWSVVLLLVVIAATACTASPQPPPSKTSPAPGSDALDQEDQAAWAMAALDACALVAEAPGVTGPGTEISPRACDGTLSGGQSLRVEVSHLLTHNDRARRIPEDRSGLLSYRGFNSSGPLSPQPLCEVAIPLSFTRAVWLRVRSAPGTPADQPCEAATGAAGAVGELLRTKPAAAEKSTPPTWNMCELRDAAFGPPPKAQQKTPGVGESTPDQCFGSREGPDFGLQVFTRADPDAWLASEPDAESVPLGDGITASLIACTLNWAQPRLPDGSAHVLTLRGAPGHCPTAEHAKKVIATLRSTPPVPSTPARLGFDPDQQDEPVHPVCRILLTLPDECRPPKDVPVPSGTDAIVQAATGSAGADLACAMLTPALTEVAGEDPLIAYTNNECVGTPRDRSFTVTLAISAYPPQKIYPEGSPTTVVGYPAISIGDDTSYRALEISPHRDVNRPGDLQVHVSLPVPLGSLATTQPSDPARLAVTDRIVRFVLETYFQ